MADKETLYDEAVDMIAGGRLDEAIARYRQAIAMDPRFGDAWHGLSMALAEKGLLDDAIEAGKRLVEIDPGDALAYTNLSRFYQQKGDVPEAEAWAAKARVLDWKRQLAGGGES